MRTASAAKWWRCSAPSGSGKTTLLRAVAGLESPKAGTISIGERSLFDGAKHFEMPAEQRNLGLVFQSYALWPHKTVFDNVAYGLKLRKLRGSEISDRVKKVLAAARPRPSRASAFRTNCRAASSSASRLRARWSTTRR